MAVDLDIFLLDRVFQPAVDRASGWITCFGLARASLVGAIALHTAVLAWDLNLLTSPLLLALITGATLAAYGCAAQVRGQIARAERQSRPGMMNIQRVTLRPFRSAWLMLGFASAAFLATSSLRPVDFCCVAVSLSWLAAIYFGSCSPSPPPARTFRSLAPCFAGAG